MSEQLAKLEKKGGDTFPDMTGATPLTIYSNRLTNLSKNGYKKIGTDVFIELAGTLNFAPSGSAYDSWRIADFPTSVLQSCVDYETKIEIPAQIQSKVIAIRPNKDDLKQITVYTYSQFSSGNAFEVRIVVHNQ